MANALCFKYLAVVQSGVGDPLAPVEHRLNIVKARFSNQWQVVTNARFSEELYLRICNSSDVSTLLYGFESWNLSDVVHSKVSGTPFRGLPKITCISIANEA